MNWIIGNIEFPEYYWTKRGWSKSDPPQEFINQHTMLPINGEWRRSPNATP